MVQVKVKKSGVSMVINKADLSTYLRAGYIIIEDPYGAPPAEIAPILKVTATVEIQEPEVVEVPGTVEVTEPDENGVPDEETSTKKGVLRKGKAIRKVVK